MSRVGWVESPLQMVNALEYAAATGESLHVCLRSGVAQLGDTGRVLAPHLPRGVTMSGPWRSATRSPMMTARRRLIGDANSGQLRALTTFTGAQDLVVVDDGSATLALARRLAEGRPLARHGKAESGLRRSLGAAAALRLRTAAVEGRLALFTAYHQADAVAALADMGATVVRNDYAWLRSTPLTGEADSAEHVVVGSAMVDDGYLDADAYEGWLTSLAGEGEVTYFPHRRESRESLRRWSAIEGVHVRRPALPIEILVAGMPGVRRVTTLPSSVVATLSTLLDASVRFDVSHVPDHWFTPRADASLRTLVTDVVSRGRRNAVA